MFCSILIFLLLVQEELGRPCLPFDETNVPNCFDFVDPVVVDIGSVKVTSAFVCWTVHPVNPTAMVSPPSHLTPATTSILMDLSVAVQLILTVLYNVILLWRNMNVAAEMIVLTGSFVWILNVIIMTLLQQLQKLQQLPKLHM